MPDQIPTPTDAPATTPHQEGVSSVAEAFPGAALGTVLVFATRNTKYAMDPVTASGVVAMLSWISSYIVAFLRQLGGQFRAAANQIGGQQ
jgi:hypothetical protein